VWEAQGPQGQAVHWKRGELLGELQQQQQQSSNGAYVTLGRDKLVWKGVVCTCALPTQTLVFHVYFVLQVNTSWSDRCTSSGEARAPCYDAVQALSCSPCCCCCCCCCRTMQARVRTARCT
jgi:hypothetical protein